MTIPHTIELESGGAICASVVNGKVLLVMPPNATLTRAECEHVGDLLWACGMQAEPPKSVSVSSRMDPTTGVQVPRAKPITSVEDERVKAG